MKSKSIVLMLIMMSALTLAIFNGIPVVSDPGYVPAGVGTWEKYGPRVDRLTFVVAGSVAQEVIDFEAGLMDIMDWAAPAAKWDAWLDPESDITMGEYGEFGWIMLALNVMRWPMGHGDMSPEAWAYPAGYEGDHNLSLWNGDPLTSDYPVGTADITYVDYDCQRCLDSRWFRRALAHLVDYDAQESFMEGAGVQLNKTFFWPTLAKDWEHPNWTQSYDQPGYGTQHLYDLLEAENCLETGGFKDYIPGDGGELEYNPNVAAREAWSPGQSAPAGTEELPKLQFYTRVDDEHRRRLGEVMSLDMDFLGIPHDLYIASYGTVNNKVWGQYDYDIYVEYWTWDPLPDLYAELFMTEADIYPDVWANNEHRYHSKEFDEVVDHFMEGDPPSTEYWAYKMQEIIHRDVPGIPVYAYVGFNAHRTTYQSWPGETKYAGRDWEGLCCYPGEGFYTFTGIWSQLNAHPEGFEKGGTLRQGLNLNPDLLDMIDSIYWYEGLILQMIYEPLIKFNPKDLTKFIPWLSSNFTQGTWEHATEGTCSAVNVTLIPGVLFQDGEPLTAEDVKFTFEFSKGTKSPNYFTFTKDYNDTIIHEDTPIPGVDTVEIRFNKKSWLATYWVQGVNILPKHIWEDVGVEGSLAYDPEDHDAVFGAGPFRFYKDGVVGRVHRVPGEYVYMEPNPLYFRKYIWPDVGNSTTNVPGDLDKLVTGWDFGKVALPGTMFAREDENGNWGSPPGAWGPHCDVNKDGKITVGDLMEIGVNYGETWPPEYYEWPE